VFLNHVDDETVRAAYLGARKGDKHGLQTLVNLAAPAWQCVIQPTDEQVLKADRALQLLYWFKTVPSRVKLKGGA
jgi:hypothetical protein